MRRLVGAFVVFVMGVAMTEHLTSTKDPPSGGHRPGDGWLWSYWIIGVAVVTLVLVGSLFFFLQSGTFYGIAETVVNRFMAPVGQVTGLGGQWPLRIHAKQIVLSDGDGSWLEASGVALEWSPWGLLHGRLDVERLGAGRLVWYRPAKGNQSTSAFLLPFVTTKTSWPWVIRHLDVDEFVLGEKIVAGGAMFGLTGRLEDSTTGDLHFKAQLVRRDRGLAQAAMDLGFSRSSGLLGVHFSMEERSGLLSAWAGAVADAPWTFDLSGTAPWQKWRGAMALVTPVFGDVTADVVVDQGNRLDWDGFWQLPSKFPPSMPVSLPPELLPADGRIPIGLTASVDFAKTTLALSRFAINLPGLQLGGRGDMGLGEGKINGELSIEGASLAPYSSLAGLPLSGPFSSKVLLSGDLANPQWDGDVQSPGVTVADTSLRRLSARLQVKRSLENDNGFDFSLRGGAESMKVGVASGGRILVRPRLMVETRVGQDQIWHVKKFQMEDASGWTVSGLGKWFRATRSGRVELKGGNENFAGVVGSGGGKLSGGLTFSGVVDLLDGGTTLDFRLRASGQKITGLSREASLFIGSGPRLIAGGRLVSSRQLTMKAVHVRGALFQGAGRAQVDLDRGQMVSTMRIFVDDLAPLAAITGKTVAGRVRLDARAVGRWQDPAVDLEFRGSNVAWASVGFDSIDGSLRGKNWGSSPQARFSSTVSSRGLRWTVAGDAALVEGGDTLKLVPLTISGPKTKIQGSIKTPLSRFSPQGELTGSMESLAVLEPWSGRELGGRVDVTVRLEKGQGLAILRGTKINGPFGVMKDGEVRVAGPVAGSGPITARVLAREFATGGLVVQRLDIRGEGENDQARFSFVGRGRAGHDFSLAGRGELQHLEDGVRVRLARLDGRLDRQSLLLQKPWIVTVFGKKWVAEDLAITLAQSHLTGSLVRENGRVNGQCRLQGDLSLFRNLGFLPMSGKVELAATVSGQEENPHLDVRVRASDLIHQNIHLSSLPPLGLAGQVQVTDGKKARVQLEVTGLGQVPVHVVADGPVLLSVVPPVAVVPSEGAIKGHLRAAVDMADLAVWAGLDEEQRLHGKVDAALDVSGSLAHPLLEGTLGMEKGGYENTTFGTTLKDIQLQARAKGNVVVLEQLRLSDGGSGRAHAQGQWVLDGQTRFPFKVAMVLDQAMVLHREDAKANVSGDLVLEGSVDAFAVRGALTVNHSEYQLKDTFGGPDIRVVGVEETGRTGTSKKGDFRQKGKVSQMDVTLVFPGQVLVHGRGLDSQWRGGLHVQGSFKEPRIEGQLEVLRGHLSFLNRRYELKKGVIQFAGHHPPRPTIHVEAVTRNREMEVTASLDGPVDGPRLGLVSRPSLPEDEILARLLFGRSAESISPAQAIRLADAVQSLRSGKTGFVDGIGQSLGIDQLDFKGDTVEHGSVNAGKYLTDKLYLEVQKGVKAELDRVNIEYDVTPEIYLQTGVDAKSNADVGIMWNRDY